MGCTRVLRLVQAVALVATFFVSLGPVAADTPSVGTPIGVALPRSSAAVTVRRGNQTASVRPLATVKTADGREAVAGRIIVRFRDGVSDAEKADIHRAVTGRGVPSAQSIAQIRDQTQEADVSGAPSLEAATQAYLADPRVQSAQPDYILHKTQAPNDPDFGQQWGMAKIQAPAAWDVTTGSPTVKIAILDCGIYEQGSSTTPGPGGVIGHPDLNGKVTDRKDFVGAPSGLDDLCDHGTHVGGIASANTNNGVGVAGVGYNVSLMNGKVLDDQGNGSDSSVVAGIYWATDSGAKVINMSLGGDGPCSSAEQDAVNYAWAHNVVLVAAAGNSGASTLFSPASCNHVIAVASTDGTDGKSGFSNFGSWVQVAAPGGHDAHLNGILSTNNLGGYEQLQGTSMASPHVAGLAGLLLSTGRYPTAQAVVDRIEGTADSVPGTGTFWQYGRINAAAAVTAVPLLRTSSATLPFGSVTATITWNTADGPGQVWVSNNGGPESLFAQGAAGAQDASFIISGMYTFNLYVGTAHTTRLASTSVTALNPKGTTGPAILARPAAFTFQPGVILNTTTIEFDTGNDSVGDVYVRLTDSPDVLFTENAVSGQIARWVQSGTYTFTLKSKATGATLDTATVTTGAGLAASPNSLIGGGAPAGASTQLTYNSGSGTPAVVCVAVASGGISAPVSDSNSGAGIETLHLASGNYLVTLYVSQNGQPITSVASAPGQCTADVPLIPAQGIQSVSIAVLP